MAEKIVYEGEFDASGINKGANQAQKAFDKVDDSADKTQKALKDTEKSASKFGKGIANLASTLKGGFGVGLAMGALDKLGQGLMENQKFQDIMNQSMIVFQGVINGVIELLEPLTTWMGKAFKDPQQALKDLGDLIVSQVTNRIEGLIELFPKLGEAISLAFKGKFSEAGKVAFDAVAKVGLGVENMSDKVAKGFEVVAKNTKKAFDLAPLLANARKQTARLEILFQGIVEKYDLMAEKQRQVRDDERKTFEERIKANEDLAKVLDEGLKAEKRNIEQRIANKRLELSLNKNSIETQNEILALQQELTGVDAKYAGLKSEQLTNIVSLQKEQKDAIQSVTDVQREGIREIAEARAGAEKDEVKRLVRERERIAQIYLDDKKRIENQLALEKEGTVRYYELLAQKAEVEKQYQVDRINNEIETNKVIEENIKTAQQQEKERLEKSLEAKLEITKQALSAIADLFSDNAELGKAVAVAQAIIDTYTGATKALAQGGIWGYIGAGAVIASGFANIRKIMQTEIPNSDGGGQSGGASAPSMPNVGVISGQMSTNAQLGGLLSNVMAKPVKSYVVGQDVNSQQALDRHIYQNATF
jgi:hypothetical protein